MSPRSIAGTIRLDNRDELLLALNVAPGLRGETGDLALALAAYERWGEACADKLLGDFAFVIRDVDSGRVFGARDPMGVTPFYYRASERGLAFATKASGVRQVDGLPLDLDEARVADVCVGGLECFDRTSTFYRNVLRLPPGHRLTFASGSTAVAPYWTPDPVREIRLGSDGEYVEAFREAFSAAVRCRLFGSVASMSSGGLDSSAIVGFARAITAANGRKPQTTLSAITPGEDCEESRHIRAVSGMAGLNPVFVRPEELSDFRATIEAFIGSLEDPFDGGMVVPLLMYAAAKRRGFKAVLDGVDGDVVASHEPDMLEPLLRSGNVRSAWREARGFARFYDGTYEPWSNAWRLIAGSAGRAFAPVAARAALRPFRQRRDVQAALAESIVSPDLASRTGIPDRLRTMWALRGASRTLTARERQARELTHPQMAAALERYHRVAASQGIEARHPFCDRRVIELCLALPWDQKVRNGWTKHIVRLATEGLLPDEVRWRRGRWVRLGPLFLGAAIAQSRDLVSAELAGDMSELAPFADLGKLRRLYRRFLDGDAGAAESVWAATALSSWLRKLRTTRYDGGALANGQAALPVHPSRDGGHSHSQEIERNAFPHQVRDHA